MTKIKCLSNGLCYNCQISFGTGFLLPPPSGRIPFEQHLLLAGPSLRQFKLSMKHVPKILKYSTSIPRLNSKFFRFKQHQHQQQRQQHLVNILISQCHIIQVYLINQFMNFGHWYIDCDWIKVKYALYLHNYKKGLLIKPMNNFFFSFVFAKTQVASICTFLLI